MLYDFIPSNKYYKKVGSFQKFPRLIPHLISNIKWHL